MSDNTEINYTFHNEDGETINLTFTIIQVEGMKGGFINYVQSMLDEVGFGKIKEVYRLMRIK